MQPSRTHKLSAEDVRRTKGCFRNRAILGIIAEVVRDAPLDDPYLVMPRLPRLIAIIGRAFDESEFYQEVLDAALDEWQRS